MQVTLRGYLRREADVFNDRRLFLNDSTLLTTKDNLGERRAGGLEFSVMGLVPPTMRVAGMTLPSVHFMYRHQPAAFVCGAALHFWRRDGQ